MRPAAALVISVMICGCAASQKSAAPPDQPYEVVDRLGTVLSIVERAHVDPVDRSRLIEGATAGMVDGLDAHSEYLSPEQYAQFLDDTEGKFGGVGVEVDFRDDEVTVVSTLPGTPAERAGLQSGDRIVALDSMPLAGMSAEQIVQSMRGPVGTRVRLTVRRDQLPEPFSVVLVRQVVSIHSVEGRRLDRDVGYVRIHLFQDGTHHEFLETLAKLSSQGPLRGLLLDLRGNPGGLVEEAIQVADELLPEGLLYTARHRGQVVEVVRTKSGDVLEKTPLVVLVDAGTASSAEIVAAAVKDRGRGLLVGSRTFGKGSVQNIIDLPGGAGMLLTTLRYFTPSGRTIQARGLSPNVEVDSQRDADATREADLDGHLSADDGGGEEPSASSPETATSDSETPADERAPLDTLAADPSNGPDPVLAVAYRRLVEKL